MQQNINEVIKFGFKEDRVLREYIIQNNVIKDTTVFSLLKKNTYLKEIEKNNKQI